MESELDAIKNRLASVEGQLGALAEHDLALYQVLVTLIRMLHEENALALPTLIAALRSRTAFGQAAFQEKPSTLLLAQIEALQALADAYGEREQPR